MRSKTIALAMTMVLAFGSLEFGLSFAQEGTRSKSLYARLGGKKAIRAVVDVFVYNVMADRRINTFFVEMASDPKRLARFKLHLVDQICQASGGPCKYKGGDMKTAHKGMGITEADFKALVEDLVRALDKFNIGEREKNELLGAFASMYGDIVEK